MEFLYELVAANLVDAGPKGKDVQGGDSLGVANQSIAQVRSEEGKR